MTFNNPKEHGYNTEKPEDMQLYYEKAKNKWGSLLYLCTTKEVGTQEHTEHDHCFLYFSNSIYRTSLQKVFPFADIRACDGTAEACRDYVFKAGKQEGTEKEESRIDGYQFEWGAMPKKQGARSDLDTLKLLILQGLSNAAIYDINASFMKYSGSIDRLRNDILTSDYKEQWRNIEVVYIQGATGTGKTRSVMDTYGYKNCCRVRKGDYPFNSYLNQDVVIFEEFRNSFKLEEMLLYLDGYPVNDLRGMYYLRTACWHKVFICSNWFIEQQYEEIQKEHPEDWQAFLRRVHTIRIYENGVFVDYQQKNIGTDEKPKYDYFNEKGFSYFHPFDYVDKKNATDDNSTNLFSML